MGYLHIANLYKDKTILMFRQCYALCKIHGTSSHIAYRRDENKLSFFSGGSNSNEFLKLFDQETLLHRFQENAVNHPNANKVTIYGEACGGKLQGMKATYGPNLKFVAFDVNVDGIWFNVPQAETFVLDMGLEFVHYRLIDTTQEAIDAEMMADSVQAVRNGMGTGHMREGIVLRPIQEFVHQGENGGRIICKHKRPEFAEREHTPHIGLEPEKLMVLSEAKAVSDEWVTAMRLVHILDAFPNAQMEDVNKIIAAMKADVEREAEGEIVMSKEVGKAIGKKTVELFKAHLMNRKD